MTNKDKYMKDLNSLILRGVELQRGLYNELRDEYKESFNKLSTEEQKQILKANFKDNYNSWYNESFSVIKQLMPERLDDFVMQYKLPKRKNTEISYLTYTISDYLMDLVVKDAFGGIKVNGTAVVTKFQQSGLTRLFYAYKQNIKEVVVAIVDYCQEETPTNGHYKVNELRIKDGPLELEDIQKRKYQHYRFIEQGLRPSSTSLL